MTIHDEFTALPISSQQRYQMRARRDAKCIICGQPSRGRSLCELHRKKKKYKDAMRKVAQQAVVAALEMGCIKRQTCEVCGKAAYAYHADFLHPLDVTWLCHRHAKDFPEWATAEHAKEGRPRDWE